MKRFFRRDDLLLLGALIVAAVLRFYHLDHSSLWHDEGNTWALIQRSFGQIARDAAADIHPPGYYWLLKVWAVLFGTSAFAMRSLSAVAGVLLVYAIYAIGHVIDDRPVRLPLFAIVAAWIAALNPFQVYYSQEARMYALLALESAGLFWAVLALQRTERNDGHGDTRYRHWLIWPTLIWPTLIWPTLIWPTLVYLFCGIAGLWTHYSFPIVLAAAGLGYLIVWLLPPATRCRTDARSGGLRRWRWDHLGRFVLLNVVILIAYLPWLSTAIERVLNWPKGGETVSMGEGFRLAIQTLLFGSLHQLPEPAWLWLLAAGLLPLLGIVALRHHRAVVTLALWLFAPLALMFGLGLFSDPFLKFLLVASPVWCLLVAAVPHLAGSQPRIRASLQVLLVAGAIAAAALVLPGYYGDANARDNYAGVAAYIDAVGNAADDLVLLNAPGQQEVWSYYDPGVPVLALPETRPPDPDTTAETLAAATEGKKRVFALFWATDEADPDRLVESWLDRMAFKGAESWQGNMRFVTYLLPEDLPCQPAAASAHFDGRFRLEAICREPVSTSVRAGDALSIGLRWRPREGTTSRYKLSLQLLDERGQVVAQRDGEPAGGSSPTSDWQPGAVVVDNHAVWIPFGTPPAEYRLTLAMYDIKTGNRLATLSGDTVDLGTVDVEGADRQVPTTVFPMQHPVEEMLGPVTLLGYDAHRKGLAHAPETPVNPGDVVEYVFYWQAPVPLPDDWPSNLQFELTLGEQVIVQPLAGDAHPTGNWHEGEQVRALFEVPYAGIGRRPRLTVGDESVRLAPLPN